VRESVCVVVVVVVCVCMREGGGGGPRTSIPWKSCRRRPGMGFPVGCLFGADFRGTVGSGSGTLLGAVFWTLGFRLSCVFSGWGHLWPSFRARLSGPRFGLVCWFSGAPFWCLSLGRGSLAVDQLFGGGGGTPRQEGDQTQHG